MRVVVLLFLLIHSSCGKGAAQNEYQEIQSTPPSKYYPVIIANHGQWEERIKFAIFGPLGTVLFETQGITFLLSEPSEPMPPDKVPSQLLSPMLPLDMIREVLIERQEPPRGLCANNVKLKRLEFANANSGAIPTGGNRQQATATFIRGNDQTEWTTDVPVFNEVVYTNLWQGHNLRVKLDEDKTVCNIEETDSAQTIKPRLVLNGQEASGTVTEQEKLLEELITEAIGKGWVLEKSRRVAHGQVGEIFLSGTVISAKSDNVCDEDCFVAELSSSGKLRWLTFIGGSSGDIASGLAADRNGLLYFTGLTTSSDLPITKSAHRSTYNGLQDYFTIRLDRNGRKLDYSTYLGFGGGGFGEERFPARTTRLLAIVVDDGREYEHVEPFLRLGIPLTFAVMPWATQSCKQAIKDAGCEILLHAPMEPLVSRHDISEQINTKSTTLQVKELVEQWLAEVPEAFGISNHQGSKATSDPDTMRRVGLVARAHGLFLFDSNTSPASVAVNVWRALGVPSLQQDFFLDSRQVEGVRSRVLLMAELAEQRGYAVCICHVGNRIVHETIANMIPELSARGFRFVTLSELYKSLNPTHRNPKTSPKGYEYTLKFREAR